MRVASIDFDNFFRQGLRWVSTHVNGYFFPPFSPAHESMLTVRKVAAALNVSRYSVYRLIEHGRLSSLRVGNAIRVAPDALREFMRRVPS